MSLGVPPLLIAASGSTVVALGAPADRGGCGCCGGGGGVPSAHARLPASDLPGGDGGGSRRFATTRLHAPVTASPAEGHRVLPGTAFPGAVEGALVSRPALLLALDSRIHY